MTIVGQVTRPNAGDYSRLAQLFPDAVATRADLLKLGLGHGTPARRCRYGMPWRRLLPGVYLLTGGEPTRRQLVRAALLRTGPLTVVTGLEAARRHGVRRIPDDPYVHILVPEGLRVSSRDFLLVERTKRAWEQVSIDGLPVVLPARAMIDHARRECRRDVVRAMIADAVQRAVCTVSELNAELKQLNLRGSALPRQVMEEVADGVRSAAEGWARSLIKRSRVPTPTWNVILRTDSGKQLGVVDAWWEEVGLAWEIDSKEFHLDPHGYERTLARHSAMTAAGVLVVHTVPSRLLRDPRGVVHDLLGAYGFASRRPKSPVHGVLWRPAASTG